MLLWWKKYATAMLKKKKKVLRPRILDSVTYDYLERGSNSQPLELPTYFTYLSRTRYRLRYRLLMNSVLWDLIWATSSVIYLLYLRPQFRSKISDRKRKKLCLVFIRVFRKQLCIDMMAIVSYLEEFIALSSPLRMNS